MKHKSTKVCALLAVPVMTLAAFGCGGTDVGENKSYYLNDDGKYPVISAEYEEESRAAIARWQNADSREKEEVAKSVAAELFAYACYNEEYIDRYVYFSNQTANTDLGTKGSGKVTTQNYKLIIRESDDTDGYKYHYTIKKVDEADGWIETFKNSFESARMRFVTETDKLYRFEGDKDTIQYGTDEDGAATEVLTCVWETGKDWGADDTPIVRREDRLDLDGIKSDIISRVDNGYEPVIHCNVNILADGIIESATITEGTIDGHAVYEIVMRLDTDVANADGASSSMLEDANSPAKKCEWTEDEDGNGPTITFQIWENGLMKYYKMDERWSGKVFLFDGEANSQLEVWYSYSDGDCDMTEKLEWLEEAKAAKETA